ncbi:MAG: hypothetical protein R2710_20560 [Acidimicrobiales bacterium]
MASLIGIVATAGSAVGLNLGILRSADSGPVGQLTIADLTPRPDPVSITVAAPEGQPLGSSTSPSTVTTPPPSTSNSSADRPVTTCDEHAELEHRCRPVVDAAVSNCAAHDLASSRRAPGDRHESRRCGRKMRRPTTTRPTRSRPTTSRRTNPTTTMTTTDETTTTDVADRPTCTRTRNESDPRHERDLWTSHPLLVHAAVVLLPIAALGLVLDRAATGVATPLWSAGRGLRPHGAGVGWVGAGVRRTA